MDCRDLILDGLARIDDGLRTAVDGLSAAQLSFQPQPSSNSIGWLAWHLTRVQDNHFSELADRPQAWLADGWHQQFNRAPDPHDTGFGHSAEEVASLRAGGPELLAYHHAVHQRSVAYLQHLSCAGMDRVIDTRWDPPVTVGIRLISVVDDCAQHLGQMAYVRGLVEGRRWFRW